MRTCDDCHRAPGTHELRRGGVLRWLCEACYLALLALLGYGKRGAS